MNAFYALVNYRGQQVRPPWEQLVRPLHRYNLAAAELPVITAVPGPLRQPTFSIPAGRRGFARSNHFLRQQHRSGALRRSADVQRNGGEFPDDPIQEQEPHR